jgi:predicted chitinase
LGRRNPNRFNIGVTPDKVGDGFNMGQINNSTLIAMGVDTSHINGLGEQLRTQFTNAGILTNSFVVMLLTNMMASSAGANGNGFANITEAWADPLKPSGIQMNYAIDDNVYGNPTKLLDGTSMGREDRFAIAYSYRGRGYIPIIGLREYEAAGNALGIKNPTLVQDPDQINDNKKLAVKVSIWKFKHFNGYYSKKPPKEVPPINYAHDGSAYNFTKTVAILNGEDGGTLDKSFTHFFSVLNQFDLLDINPGGTQGSGSKELPPIVAGNIPSIPPNPIINV